MLCNLGYINFIKSSDAIYSLYREWSRLSLCSSVDAKPVLNSSLSVADRHCAIVAAANEV